MEDGGLVTDALLPLALAIVMGSLGLSLTPADFKRVLTQPRGVGIGITNLLLVSPLLAFAIAELYGLSPELAVGLVLLGASPGGTTANFFTHLARGDTALSVSMTAISSVAAVVTVPLYLGLAIDHFGASFADDPEMLGIVARVLLITVVPLAIGMALRPRFAHREDSARKVAMVVFVLVIIGAVVAEFDLFVDNVGELAAATLTLNVLAMSISFTVARLARLDNAQSTAIAMELGVHNGTLAIAVAGTIATVLAVPAAVYSAFMFLTAGLFARAMHRRNAPPAPVPA